MSLAQRAATERRAYDNARRDEAAATIADLTERLHRERVLRQVWHDRAVRAGWVAGVPVRQTNGEEKR